MSTSLEIWSSSGSYPRILTASFCILFQGDCVHSFAFNYYLNVDISYIIPSDHTFLLSSTALYLLDIYIWLSYRHFKFNQVKSEHIIIRSPPSQLSSLPCFLYLWMVSLFTWFSKPKTGATFLNFPPKSWVLSRILLFLTFNIQLITKSCWFYLTDLFRTYPLSSTPAFISLSLLGIFTLCSLHLELPSPCFSFTRSLYL